MDEFEFLTFIIFSVLTFLFFRFWYSPLTSMWPPERLKKIRRVLSWVPLICFIPVFITLQIFAAYDVLGFYVFYYILFGFAWLYAGCWCLFIVFDLSYTDDVLAQNNMAAAVAVTGSMVGLTFIYCGANFGDGPGWWCVLFAGALGYAVWFILGLVLSKTVYVIERITSGRDLSCALRFAFYLVASGLILGRACGGDWTSWTMTIYEFLVGWPVIILTVAMIGIEKSYIRKEAQGIESENEILISSVIWGMILVLAALVTIWALPSI